MKRNFLKILFIVIIAQLIIAEVDAQTMESLPQKTTAKKEFPNPFRPIGNFFKRVFSNQPQVICQLIPAFIEEIELSQTEIVQKCSLTDKSCSENSQLIQVTAKGKDFESDVLTYKYEVSKGKIIGEGQKVIWDLSDVTPGTYSITAAVDDGCGFCGPTVTKTVTVKECLNCN